MAKTAFSKILDQLIKDNPKPDGSQYTYAEIQRGTGGVVSAEYVRQLHKGIKDNPGLEVIEALSVFFDANPAKFFPALPYRKDRHFRQIVVELSLITDRELFEACVIDLLQDEFEGMTPIPGGQDMGMDGAFPTGGESFCPVVVTTSKSGITNLTDNLESYLENDLPSRKIVFATSKELSQKQRKNLIAKAEEYGFQFVAPPYDQISLAYRLYRHPRLCKELLGISGTPPALSVVPERESYFPDIELIGRESDLKWLQDTTGDRLLVGEPGLGKTFLLRNLVSSGIGLFVVRSNLTDIANDIREHAPETLIMEDVQYKQDLLEEIAHLRTQIGADFSILASCWPEQQEMVAQTLGITGDKTHELDLLDRKTMAKIIKAMGFSGPDEHIAFILSQVEGKPGLAAVLVWDYLQGNYQKLNRGETITNAILRFVDKEEKYKAQTLLAAFSLGGDSGVDKNLVADELRINELELRGLLQNLSNCGIVHSSNNNVIVRPKIMREALVRDIIFGDTSPVDKSIFRAISNQDELAFTLIGAMARGASIHIDTLRAVLVECSSDDPWLAFANLGAQETKWVLENFPEKLLGIAPAALEHAPHTTIPKLLSLSVDDGRQLHSNPDHPLRKIKDWVERTRPGLYQGVRRRKLLIDEAKKWLRNNEDTLTGLRALHVALAPTFLLFRDDPIEYAKIKTISGALRPDALGQIKDEFVGILEVLSSTSLKTEHWKILLDIIEDWAYPGRIPGSVPNEVRNAMKNGASSLIRSLLPLAKGQLGIEFKLYSLSDTLNLKIDVDIPGDFKLLFENDFLNGDKEAWEKRRKKRNNRIRAMAKEWAMKSPSEIAKALFEYEQAARIIQNPFPNRFSLLCNEIASAVSNPGKWVEVFRESELSDTCIYPFLDKWLESDVDSFTKFASENYSDRTIGQRIQWLILTMEKPPEENLDQVIESFDRNEVSALQIQIWGRISDKSLDLLINHPNQKISTMMAIYEWSSNPPRGHVREEIFGSWEKAIVNVNVENLSNTHLQYEFKDILSKNGSISYTWLKKQIQEDSTDYFNSREFLVVATSNLDTDQRKEIISLLPNSPFVQGVAAAVVGSDIQIYKELLQRSEADYLHLAPLARTPGNNWMQMAELAHRNGYTPEQIAHKAVYQTSGVVDAHSSAWLEKSEVFDELISHEEELARKIGQAGKDYCMDRYQRAKEEERHRAVYGLH